MSNPRRAFAGGREVGGGSPIWPAAAAVLAGLGVCWAETRWPLRRKRDSKRSRNVRNLVFAVLSAVTIQVLQEPIVGPLSRRVQSRRWGLLKQAPLPPWLETGLALMLMDYTLYLWHVLTHRVPFLWRFHRPHHADLEMDASTALRFHFGEMALSVPWRAAQVVAIGVSPRVLALWQRLVVLSILFHHSNLRLPVRLERGLATVIVTPRLHEIHHSVFSDERNSNWSSGLTLWDRLHGTLRTGHAASAVTIGLPEHRTRREVSLARMLGAPFVAPASRAAKPRAGLASSRRASGRARPGGPRAG